MNLSDLNIKPENDPAALPENPDSTFRWATVVNVDPLTIRLDGESAALAATPSSLAEALDFGDRVWTQLHGRALIVLGRGTSGAATRPEWIRPALQNGWVEIPFLMPIKYCMFNGLVHLRGVGKDGTTDAVVFTLPEGFRPEGTLYFPAVGTSGVIEVHSDGVVRSSGAASGNYLFFDSVQFIPEPGA